LSPGFITALFLLIINDYYLKQNFPCWLTGKLSDFSGLFLFSLFWSSFFPKKNRIIIILCAILFVFWKSPLSQVIIDVWNRTFPLNISRVIDYSDLLAIAILPLSRLYFLSIKKPLAKKAFAYPTLIVSFMAIMGTSYLPPSYTVRFQMQKVSREAISSDINEEIGVIAKNYGLACTNCYSDKNFRRYESDNIHLQTNFDNYSATLFVSIHAHEPGINKNKVDQIQKSVYSALNSKFKNITVERDSTGYTPKSDLRVRRIQINTPLKKFPFPSWCESSIKSDLDLMKSYSEVKEYMFEKKFGHAVKSPFQCYYPRDECMQQLCRYYVFGRVTGAREYDHSTSLRLDFSYDWTQTTLTIEITEHTQDDTINTDGIISELTKRIQIQLSPEAEIEILPDEMPQ